MLESAILARIDKLREEHRMAIADRDVIARGIRPARLAAVGRLPHARVEHEVSPTLLLEYAKANWGKRTYCGSGREP